MKRLLRAFCLLLPLALFVLVLLRVRTFFDEGSALSGVGLMLGALALLALSEGLMFRYWLLPLWGRAVSNNLYSGTYTPDQDPLVVLVERIRRHHDRELMRELHKLVERDAGRARGWAELSALYELEFHDYHSALQALLSGAEKVSSREDRALFLYRAALMCERRLENPRRVRELCNKAASNYPRTIYGMKAAAKLASLSEE